MTVPGRLTVGSDGRLRGDAKIEYNNPFPCVNSAKGSGAMNGVVMHTMVCDLPECIRLFNDPARQASAFFGIAQDGTIHQFIPVGQGYMSWAQMAGNASWYSIEHADHGVPDNPLTPEQIAASAQVVECLSAFAGFPLQVTDSVTGKGYGVHYMGGQAWGGHTCPDTPPQHVRSSQRPAIIDLAKQIRSGGGSSVTRHMYDGINSDAAPIARAGFSDLDMVGGYVDGRYAWSDSEWKLFSGKPWIRISAIPGSSEAQKADVADCETGDYTPAQAAAWAAARKKGGYFRPTIYCNLSTAPSVRVATGSMVLGVDYDIWLADYDGIQQQFVFSDGRKCVAKQYSSPQGGFYDKSVVFDSAWPRRTGSAPAPTGPFRHVVPVGNTESFTKYAAFRSMTRDALLSYNKSLVPGTLTQAHYNVLAALAAADAAAEAARVTRPSMGSGTIIWTKNP